LDKGIARARWNIKPASEGAPRKGIVGGLGCGLDVEGRRRFASGELEGVLDELGMGGDVGDSTSVAQY
jgi:hypothetical protein